MNACRPAQMPPTPKNVLMAIADRADDSGLAWPSIAGICEATCYGRTAVWEALKTLEASGLLLIEKQDGRNSRYTIVLDRLEAFIPAKPVRQTDTYPSATRTGADVEPIREANTHPSATRTPPVRQTDTPHSPGEPEPSVTLREQSGEPSGRERASRTCPPSFALTPEIVAWAKDQHPAVDVQVELDKFRDHEFKQAHSDWPKAFRNWVRRASEWHQVDAQQRERRETATERKNRVLDELCGRKPGWRETASEKRARVVQAFTGQTTRSADVIDVEAHEVPRGGVP